MERRLHERELMEALDLNARHRRQDELLAKIALHIPGMIYQFQLHPDGSSDFPYASVGALQLFGMAPSGTYLPAKPIIDRIHPDDQPAFFASVQTSAQEMSSWNHHFRYNHPNGQVRWLHGHSNPERLDDGSILWHGFVTDVTEQHLATEALKRSEAENQFLALVAKETGNGVIISDTNGRITWVNAGFTRITGYDLREITGEKLDDFILRHHDDRKLAERVRTAMDARQPCSEDIFSTTKHGQPIWLRLNLQSLDLNGLSAMGINVGYIAISTDITAAKTLEERLCTTLNLQQAIFDATDHSVISTDTAGIVTAFNAGAERMLGYSANEIIGRATPLIFHVNAEIADTAHRLTQELGQPVPVGMETFTIKPRLHNAPFQSEWTYVHKHGHHIPVQLTITAIRDDRGAITGYLGVANDITIRKQHEALLRQALKDAQAASKAKADFLAVMSHEIRTPMNGVIGMTHLLGKTVLNQQQQEYVGIIRSSGENLLSLINDILDFSKMEAERLELEHVPFALSPLIGELTRLFGNEATKRNLHLSHLVDDNIPHTVLGDPGRLRQILTNLVANALKFTERGTVVITLEMVARTDDLVTCRFSVMDTGLGMRPDQIARIGQPFTQADASTTRRFGGTGLGLSICKRLLALMDSHLVITSTMGKGSTFSFTMDFPVIETSQRAALPTASASEPARPLHLSRLLVAEDVEVNQLLIAAILKDVVDHIDVVGNGADAVTAVQQRAYDCILMDCQMPDMDGYDATRIIREHEQTTGKTRLPIIALTANALSGDRQDCLDAGMDDYLSKPLDPDALMRVLARHCQPRSHPAP
jgi:PAS domain S-box-containing protein